MMLESEFTAPREDCPHPEHWHASDGESTEWEVTQLVASFITALQPDFVLETGTAFGQTAYAIGTALRESGHGRLVTLELDHRRAEASRRLCTGLPVTVVEQHSMEFLPPDDIDFMWLDSEAEFRGREIERFAAYASARCVIGVHDTGPHHVTRSYLEPLVTAETIEPPLYLPTPRGVCFTRLRDTSRHW